MNDKTKHFLAGAAVALFVAAIWVVASRAGLVDMRSAWLAAALSAGVAGLTKEAADHLDNAIHPGMHAVELADVLATTAGGLVVALALLVLMRASE